MHWSQRAIWVFLLTWSWSFVTHILTTQCYWMSTVDTDNYNKVHWNYDPWKCLVSKLDCNTMEMQVYVWWIPYATRSSGKFEDTFLTKRKCTQGYLWKCLVSKLDCNTMEVQVYVWWIPYVTRSSGKFEDTFLTKRKCTQGYLWKLF